jgi:D-alanine-D-alanine ligase-like ATP-grasp enzyme
MMGCYDCGRVDVRLDDTDIPCVMEVSIKEINF